MIDIFQVQLRLYPIHNNMSFRIKRCKGEKQYMIDIKG